MFGSPSLTDSNGAVPPALGWGKPLALLCLLAVRSEAPRDEIVDLLWRGVDEAKARNAFRQALHRLRSALGEELLPQDRERLGLVRSERITIDLDGFEAAARAGRLDEAIRLYRGDFLEDARLDEPAFDMWADQHRSTLRSRFQRVLESGIAGAESEGRWTDAIEYCHRLLAIAPFEASAALLAASTLVSAGRRLDALELLRQFGSRLQAELGLSMPAELQSLLSRLDRQTDQPGRKQSIGTTTSAAAPPLLFVGREAELTQLLSLWRTTADDAGALAIVEGELGVGKTRLVRELGRHAKSLGAATVLTGRERANIAQVPFGVFAEALRPLVRAPGIVGASKHLLAEAARLLPELRDSLDLPIVHDVEDEAERVRFFEGVAALVDAAAYEHPLLMVLEDLQYVAPSSLDLLTYLCARLAGSPVMFALTLRATDGPAATVGRLRALAEASDTASPPHGRRALRLVLTPLRRADIATAIGGPAKQLGLSPAVVDRITDRASGIPGRVEELLRRAAAGDDIVTLPVSASALVTERLQRLSSSQRRLFLVMSLIARPAQIRTIAAAAHMTQHAAADSLRVLETEGLVETNEHGSIAAVELPAVTALETAGAASRAFLSGWIAEALAQDPDAPPAELARFFAQAGQTALAFEHARRAAFSALAMGALNEAVASFASARSFAPGPGEQAEIEGILTGLGSGKRRLLSSVRDSTTEAPILTEPAEREGPRAPPTWEGLFPNWRILLGAALATLVISTFVLWRAPASASPARALSTDTLVVSEGESARAYRFATGDLSTAFILSQQFDGVRSEPPWLDSLNRPWTDALASPRGQHVAVARVRAGGSDTYVISADKRDTIPIVVGKGDAKPLGWSPDGKWLLATTTRTLSDGTFDADLFAYGITGASPMVVVDSSSRRSVTEAAWAPDGSRIAWVARAGAERQLEVFTSLSDGTGVQNVSRHPADDQHISWSPDGELLAFTSTRDGNSELYAVSARENRRWRLTRDPAQDDLARFSANGRMVAFESTRGGTIGVYVMPALGGEPHRIGGSAPLSLVSWRGGRMRFIDRVRVQTRHELEQGETTRVELLAFDQFGDVMTTHVTDLQALDSALVRVIAPMDSAAPQWAIVARRPGIARVVASLGRWRFDTTEIRVGRESLILLDAAADPANEWMSLGEPLPRFDRAAPGSVVLNADREWESGVLSRRAAPLLPGLTLSVVVQAPIGSAHDAAMAVSIALVASETEESIDRAAPQFLRYVSFGWNADADRLVYSVGREIFTESVETITAAPKIPVRLRIESDSTVSFTVAGQQRWRSTLRAISARHESRAQVWLGGRATEGLVRLSDIDLRLAGGSARTGRD